jgi:hypothetical protein
MTCFVIISLAIAFAVFKGQQQDGPELYRMHEIRSRMRKLRG